MQYYGGMRGFDEGSTKMDELDCELWHACAGPLTQLPPVDSHVMYWPQGHIEQVCILALVPFLYEIIVFLFILLVAPQGLTSSSGILVTT